MKDATQDSGSDKVQIEVTRAELCMILDGLCSDVNYVDDPMECSGIVNHRLAKEMDVLHDAIITNLKEELFDPDGVGRWLIADDDADDDDDDDDDDGPEDSGTDVTISRFHPSADATYGPEGPVYLDGKLVCTNAAYDVIRKHVIEDVKEHLDGADVETMEALDDLA